MDRRRGRGYYRDADDRTHSDSSQNPRTDRSRGRGRGPRAPGYSQQYDAGQGTSTSMVPQSDSALRSDHPRPQQQHSGTNRSRGGRRGRGRGRGGNEAAAFSSPPQELVEGISSMTMRDEEQYIGEKEVEQRQQTSSSRPSTSATVPSASVSNVDKIWDIPSRKGKTIEHNSKVIDRRLVCEVNYLPINMDITKSNIKIYHYDVAFNPETPKYLLRDALRQMQVRYFKNRDPAFDGRKNLFVPCTKLSFPNGDTVRDKVTVNNPESARDKEFDVTIKLVNHDIKLSTLFTYMKEGKTSNMPQEAIQAVDIALRSSLSLRFITVGRSFFSQPTRTGPPVDLGDGLELWHGFYQSAIMAWKPYLNVDVANKGFPRAQPVLDYLRNDMQIPDDVLRQSGLPQSRDQTRLFKFLKGLKIDYLLPNDPTFKRTFKVTGLGKNAFNHWFTPKKDDKRQVSVAEFYDKHKNIRLQYPNLPLIQVLEETMLPAEFCHITRGQVVMRKLDRYQTDKMVRAAATATFIRKERIEQNIRQANYNNDKTLSDFGIKVDMNFEKVDAIVLKPPTIGYRGNEIARVNNGVWRSDKLRFINSPGLRSWAVINTDNRCRNGRKLVDLLQQQGAQMGIEVSRPIVDETFIDRPDQRKLENCLKDLRKHNVMIVVVIMGKFPQDLYNFIKRASEFNTGVLTQCIKSSTVDRVNPMIATNLLLKINAKINGTNHEIPRQLRPPILNEPCIIIGADVTHPSPGSEGFPSIAAVAASHDLTGFQYNMMYSLQPSRTEMILDLEEMIKAQLLFFHNKVRTKPTKILYFRDGVSEGQFQQLLNIEMQAIRRACLKLEADYNPGLTMLVVQKRHHTRFFPSKRDSDGSRNQNVPSGTLVDSKITHPTELDFYLVSHQSIQGTARPTKYHLLWDDNNLGDEELEILTFYLCFMFTRCNRAVSYPAPTYYAHLAAFRARAWFDGLRIDMADLKGTQRRIGTISSSITTQSPMFFV